MSCFLIEADKLIMRDVNWHHDWQDFQYISQKPYGKRSEHHGSLQNII